MSEFLNPFNGVVKEKITNSDLIRAIRQALAAEHEAVHLYTAIADATNDERAKKVLIDIANEERVHAGEFQKLLDILTDGEESKFIAEGYQEVEELLNEKIEKSSDDEKTIGGLK